MPAALIYVQHLLGIGHLMRARRIAEALAEAGFAVHLVSGGMPPGGRAPLDVQVLQLPPIYAADATLKPLLDARGQPVDEAYRRERRDLLLAAFEAAAPAVVIFETYPFGRRALRFEIVPLLERIHAIRPRPIVIASVRDILQVRSKEGREQEMLEAANRWFDAVLVHGDRRFARLDETFALTASLRPRVHYTGFVANRVENFSTSGGERREVIVSAGGGAVGTEMLATALAARPLSRFGRLPWRVLVGTNVADADFRRLQQEASGSAEGSVVVERARPDFAALLRQSLISVSQAGYNTTIDVCTSGARGVFVPFAANGETEQLARARRLRQLDLGVVVEDVERSPTMLAAAIDAAGSKERWGRWQFDCDGAERSAALVAEMCGISLSHARDPA